MTESITITPSEIIEYNFCPRFIYYMNCLGIEQNEDKRFKVLKGREIHEDKSKINHAYLRKKLGVVDKKINVYMLSEKLRLRGEVDEVLFLNDGTAAPLDYKYAEYNEKIFKTHKYQLVHYALLIEDKFQKPVNRGYICYTRSSNYLHEVSITPEDKQESLRIVSEVFDIIINETFPKATKTKAKCEDCCYRNICVK